VKLDWNFKSTFKY